MSALKYLLYPPKGEVQPRYPLILWLHGVGERGDDLELVKKWSLARFVDTGEVELPAYLVAPQCPADVRWSGTIPLLSALLDDLLAQYPIDTTRVYLTGFSMGSRGTWRWAVEQPERFAALMPVSGSGAHPTDNVSEADLAVLKTIPIWMVHGAVDTVAPVSGADWTFATLLALGASVGYTRYPDADHGQASDRAFRDKTILSWLVAQKRSEA